MGQRRPKDYDRPLPESVVNRDADSAEEGRRDEGAGYRGGNEPDEKGRTDPGKKGRVLPESAGPNERDFP
ncbi:hypothetical protein [Bailinhaonella thermotolerans]|uniref:hypothetical protein n=1 Tax=Bailinhaonella thermotolerans TaxID=1070861 RepID=UPI0011C3949E|nr:hypothetical protein [Bailinhaonella thermotolerans]